MVLFRVVFVTRRPFLESPGNLSGLELYFKIKIEKKANYFVALKPVHFVSLADESIIKISKLEIPIFSENRTALRARRVTWGSFLEGPGNLSGPQTCYVFIHPKGLKFFKNYPAKISA